MRARTWCWAGLIVAACGGGGGDVDASRVVTREDGALCGAPGSSADADPCLCTSDCQPGAACLPEDTSHLAGGFCRRPCDTTACAPGYTCRTLSSGAYCARTCAGPSDCGPSRVCTGGVCIAFCLRDSDCHSGRCNRYSGVCIDPSTEVTGAGISEPCLRDTDCRSDLCSSRGGCLVNCSIAGQTCPDGATCVGDTTSAADDWGLCMMPCEADGTCALSTTSCITATTPAGSRVCALTLPGECTGPAGASPDSGACGCNADCAGGVCATEAEYGWSHGWCNHPCTQDTECGSLVCDLGACSTPCTLHDNSVCRTGYICDGTACQPVCQSDAECAGGHCDLYRGLCAPTDAAGAGVGATCSADADCRSHRCNRDGWPEGYCVSFCSVQHPNCPEGAYCRPAGFGDYGACTPLCTTRADCAQASADCVTEMPGAPLHCW